jgi:hypothetical protein
MPATFSGPDSMKESRIAGVNMNDTFLMKNEGRCGTIVYEEEGRTIEIPWERSGSPRYNILLAPLDLRKWASGEDIPRPVQRQILDKLREWLATQNCRANIASLQCQTLADKKCVARGCSRRAVQGYAYCLEHYDETLLR